MVAHSEQKQTLGTEQPRLLSQFVTDNESLFFGQQLDSKALSRPVFKSTCMPQFLNR